MSNTSYELNWKTFLKCKECNQFKELNKDNRYSHKQWYLWVVWRCKECILKWRHSEREHEMARKRDIARYNNDPKRRAYVNKCTNNREKRHNEEMPKRMAYHQKAHRLIKKLWIRPKECPICWRTWRIIAHHPDVKKRNEITFCCQPCHTKIHQWIPLDYKLINLLDSKLA